MSTLSLSIQAPEQSEAARRIQDASDGTGERELIDQARTDPDAFGRLYRLHYRAIAGMLYRRTGDADTAEDLAAQTFINAWRGLERYQHTKAPFRAWLMRIATNEARRWTKRQSRRRDVESSARPSDAREPDQDLGAEVRAAIGSLSLNHQDVLTLVYFESLTIEQAASVLGIRPGTVKSRLSRARESLKNELGRRETRA